MTHIYASLVVVMVIYARSSFLIAANKV